MCQLCHAEKGEHHTAEPPAGYKCDQGISCVCYSGGSDTLRRTYPLVFCFMFSFNVTDRTSSAIRCLLVDPIRGTACVDFKNGYAYSYINVSRRAILNLLAQPNMSLGFWVNNNLVNATRVYENALQHG